MKRFSLLIIIALLFSSGKIYAQKKSHEQAAERVLIAMDLQKNLEGNYQALLNDQLSRVLPANKATFTTVMNKLKDKYANWNEAKKTFVSAYTAAYSETELNDLEKFFTSASGKKFMDKQPDLNKLESDWMKKTMSVHQSDLMQMMGEAMKPKKP